MGYRKVSGFLLGARVGRVVGVRVFRVTCGVELELELELRVRVKGPLLDQAVSFKYYG